MTVVSQTSAADEKLPRTRRRLSGATNLDVAVSTMISRTSSVRASIAIGITTYHAQYTGAASNTNVSEIAAYARATWAIVRVRRIEYVTATTSAAAAPTRNRTYALGWSARIGTKLPISEAPNL